LLKLQFKTKILAKPNLAQYIVAV